MSTTFLPTSLLAYGALRNLVVPTYTQEGSPAQFGADPRGAMYVSQDLPERAEIARLGGTVIMRTDAVACITAVPTVTAAHALWNGEASGGKAYVIDRLTWICTTSAGAASQFSFVAVVNKAVATSAPATVDTQAQTVYTTGKGYAGKAKVSHTVTVVDDVWFAVGQTTTPSALTTTVGVGLDAPINGAIILAPGYVLGVSVMAVNATAKGTCHFWFHEVQLPVVTS